MARELQYIELPEILKLHEDLLAKFGWLSGTKNIWQLESVLSHIRNDTYYPSILEKATHLFHSLVAFHCFTDGNKRTAIYSTWSFLLRNGYIVEDFLVKCEDIAIWVASNELTKEDIQRIFRSMFRSFGYVI